MRKSATGISYRCRLITLLLILLNVFIIEAAQVLPYYKPDFGLQNVTFPDHHLEPTVEKPYYFLSRCSKMFVRIKLGSRRNSVDASGEMYKRYTLIIMESIGSGGRVRLRGEDSRKYLCFTKKGKLRAMHPPQETCNLIYNKTSEGYYQFRLEANERWYVGFKRKKIRNLVRGKALPGYKKLSNSRLERCYDFTGIPNQPNHKPTPMPYSPVDFNTLGDKFYDPKKPRIRHQPHRKRQRRRKLRHRNSKKRKRPGS